MRALVLGGMVTATLIAPFAARRHSEMIGSYGESYSPRTWVNRLLQRGRIAMRWKPTPLESWSIPAIAVPPLPHGGSAVGDLVQPRRITLREQQPEGDVIPPRIGECGQHVRGTQEAGGEVSAVRRDVVHQPGRNGRAQAVGRQTEGEREDSGGLRGVGADAVRVH